MRVLHISGARSWGGSEQQLMYLMDELPKYGVEQKLLCYDSSPIMLAAKEKPVEVLAIPFIKPTSSAYRKNLNEVVRKHNIDIIHLQTNDAVTGYVLTDIFYKLNTPTILARKSVRTKHSFLSKLKYNYKNIHVILCVSKYVERHFSRILTEKNKKKTVIVHDSVKVNEQPQNASFDLREKYNIDKDSYLIGNIANHTKAKDHPVLIKTLYELVHVKGIKNVKIIQIGQFSPLTEELKSLVKKFDLEEYIIYTDFIKDASSLMKQFDVFLMTSSREGGPSSVLEAFYNQVPVVSTRVGVVDEVIEDGVNGFSTEIKNPGELAEKLIILKENKDLQKKFKERSYDLFLAGFTADKLGKKTFEVYKSMLETDTNMMKEIATNNIK